MGGTGPITPGLLTNATLPTDQDLVALVCLVVTIYITLFTDGAARLLPRYSSCRVIG